MQQEWQGTEMGASNRRVNNKSGQQRIKRLGHSISVLDEQLPAVAGG